MNAVVPTVEEIRAKLGSDPRWVQRGIVRLYEYQTAEEQQVGHTKQRNEVGFNGSDSSVLTSFAKQILGIRRNPLTGLNYKIAPRPLTEEQLAVAYERMSKYAAQLHRIALAKEGS